MSRAKKMKPRPRPKVGELAFRRTGMGFDVALGMYDVGRLMPRKKGGGWIAVTSGGLRVGMADTPAAAARQLATLVA